MRNDLRFKHLFTCIIMSHCGSGKSSFCIQFLQNLDALCTEHSFDGGVIWCCGEKNASPSKELAPVNVGKRIHFHEGVAENFSNGEGKACLIILDDLLNEVYSKEVCYLFKKGSLHRNINVILITQKSILPGALIQGHLSKCKVLGTPKEY